MKSVDFVNLKKNICCDTNCVTSKMNSFVENNDCNDNIISISDDVIVVSSSSSDDSSSNCEKVVENKGCSGHIITISDDVIVVSSSTSSSSTGNFSNCEKVISVSSDGGECENVIIITDDDRNSLISFDFESSSKLFLPQPRTSTPLPQRRADDEADNCKCDSVFFILILT